MVDCTSFNRILNENYIEKGEVMAFGDNGKRKKTLFEKVTLVVVLIMLFVTLAGIFATALGAFSRF